MFHLNVDARWAGFSRFLGVSMRNMCVVFLLALLAFPLFSSTSVAGTFPVASTAEQSRLMMELRAQQFLNRATFGATDTEIAALATRMQSVGLVRACSDWIDEQFALSPTLHGPTTTGFMSADGFNVTSQIGGVPRFRHHAWWHNSISAPDQLKQRLAWALIQICVVSETAINDSNFVPATLSANQPAFWLGMGSYYDMLLNRLNGSYRDVLQGVTQHPQMGMMLSSLRNQKGNAALGTFADENYAREIMQLMSIGLYELNTDGSFKKDAQGQNIPTYDNDLIEELARSFTGYNYALGNGTSITSGDRDFVNTMIMTGTAHDTGSKQLLNGQTIPGNADGNAGISATIDNIYAHPNVGPFISRLLIQRLVMSNPSRAYISRVTRVFNNNGVGVKGDMKAVMKAILLDNDAWSSIQTTRLSNPLRLQVASAGTEFCRLVEPVVQYASFCRRYGVPSTTAPTSGRWYVSAAPGTWNQSPFRSPSVFNFYLPDHQPSGGISTAQGSTNIPEKTPGSRDLYSPEFQLVTAVVANAWHNRTRSDIVGKGISMFLYTDTGVTPNVSFSSRINFPLTFEESIANDVNALVLHLDKVLCNGTMTETFKTNLTAAILAEVPQTTTTSAGDRTERVRGAMISVMNSPFYLIRF